MIPRLDAQGRVNVDAPAKLNLFLEVLGKRPDGFHELATLMVAIDLCDEITVSPGDELSLVCDVPELTVGPDNLVLKAARKLQQVTGRTDGAAIRLTKRVPWAAGLGGGSSDAAATLMALNELWQLGLPRTELARIAGELGSDVPFFLFEPAAWCTGRGEIVTPVPLRGEWNFVLLKPPEGLGTADVYRRLVVPATPRDGQQAIDALAAGDVEAMGRSLHNRLMEPAFALSETVSGWHRRLLQAGTAGALLSGSGSCLFALCRSADEAERVIRELQQGSPPGPGSPRFFQVRSRP